MEVYLPRYSPEEEEIFLLFCSIVSILHSLMTVSTRFTAVLNVRLSQLGHHPRIIPSHESEKNLVFVRQRQRRYCSPLLLALFGNAGVKTWSLCSKFKRAGDNGKTVGRFTWFEDECYIPEIFFSGRSLDVSSLERKTGAAVPFFRLTCERWDLSTQLLCYSSIAAASSSAVILSRWRASVFSLTRLPLLLRRRKVTRPVT